MFIYSESLLKTISQYPCRQKTVYLPSACLSSLSVLTNCSSPHHRSMCMTTLSALLKVPARSPSHVSLECIMIRAYWPHLLSWGLDRLLGGDRQSTCDNRSRQGVWGTLGLSLHQRLPDMPLHPDTDRQAFPSDTAACQAHRAPATQVDGWMDKWMGRWMDQLVWRMDSSMCLKKNLRSA